MNLRRRDFVFGVAGAAASPRVSHAQQLDRIKRIGVLLLFAADDPEGKLRVTAFEEELHRNGWNKNYNVQIEYRFAAGDFGRMGTLARELIELPADVIVTNALSPIIAARQGGRIVPVVFAMVPNPVEQGLIGSLSHPDENITGFTNFEYSSIVGKWLDLLKAIAPRVTRVGIMFNPDAYYSYLPPPRGSYWVLQLEAAASSFSVEPVALPVRDLTEVRDALNALGHKSNSSLLVATDVFTVAHYPHIVTLARQYRIPGCYPFRYFAFAGGLMSYGPNGAHAMKEAASYVDRILRGTKASQLPIRRPTVLELVINLKTAKALAITVPPLLLARADEVIE